MYYFLEATGAAAGGSLVSTVSTLVMLVAMVLVFYFFNLIVVGLNIIVYFRNKAIEEKAK